MAALTLKATPYNAPVPALIYQFLLVIGVVCTTCVALTIRVWQSTPEAKALHAISTSPIAPDLPTTSAGKASAPQLDDHEQIALAAQHQIGVTRIYDPAYVSLRYPGGDVPIERGVCCDVVIRALRSVGLDLQKAVHEDMATNFARYPGQWGLQRPDSNIDHRRVPNLMTWFSRHGWSVANDAKEPVYQAGDIVAWNLGNGRMHIGIVTVTPAGSPEVVHNIGRGTVAESVLFQWEQIGHYRLPLVDK